MKGWILGIGGLAAGYYFGARAEKKESEAVIQAVKSGLNTAATGVEQVVDQAMGAVGLPPVTAPVAVTVVAVDQNKQPTAVVVEATSLLQPAALSGVAKGLAKGMQAQNRQKLFQIGQYVQHNCIPGDKKSGNCMSVITGFYTAADGTHYVLANTHGQATRFYYSEIW